MSFTITAYFNFIFLQALSIVTDFYYYGKWTSSVLNLLIYNVAGGGESHLYGIEGPLYYLRNGFNNFNICFVLALLFLGILPIAKKKYAPDLLIVISPIYIWLGFMSLQPHKEERFGWIFNLVFYYKVNHMMLFPHAKYSNIFLSRDWNRDQSLISSWFVQIFWPSMFFSNLQYSLIFIGSNLDGFV